MDSVIYTPRLKKINEGDISIFIDPDSPNWVAVNSPGAEVLELCDGKRTASEIVSQLAPRYKVSDVKRFIGEATDCEIVKTEPFLYKSYKGRAVYLSPESLDEIWVYVTNECNLRCKHCLVSAGENPKKELSSEKLKDIIHDIAEHGVKRVFFTGGEPFSRAEIFELIEYVTLNLKLELVILSNGTLFDKKTVLKLSTFPGLVIQVSIEGPTAEINDSIRGDGAFKKALAGVELLRANGIRTIVTSTAQKNNLTEIPELNELLYKNDVRTHHVLWVHERGRAAKNPVTVSAKALVTLMTELKGRKVKVDNWESFKARVYGKRGTKVDGCHAGFSSLSIDSNGDIYPCPSLNGDSKFLMGNVKEGLKEVWLNSKLADNFRETSVIQIEDCKVCEFRFLCGGGCRCQAYYAGEKPSLLSKDPYCEVIKKMLVESMLSFVSPNGQNKPEIRGNMQKRPSLCDGGELDSTEVMPFHCTCVLDVAAHKNVSARYGTAAGAPEQELCCPTGYTDGELENLPSDTISISYGCGNPTAFGDLEEGETVLDIGAGGGIDCFIAAKKVGRKGRVIGVDMTNEMLDKAKKNNLKMAEIMGYDIVDFRKGLAEELPASSNSVDLVISNCVINLSPDKGRVFEEIYRVLKTGGRFSISDIVSDSEVPEEMKQDAELWSGCISGALPKDEFLKAIMDAGFNDVKVEKSSLWKEIGGMKFYSVTIKGKKS